MRVFLRILGIASGQWRWLCGGILLGLLVIAVNTLLMALSGWFIASMAVAGATGIAFNYFFPAAAIRALAIVRTVGRYGERLVTHEAALRMVADLRVWLFLRLEPLSPAILEKYAGGDVAGRLRADVDLLENVYLRIFAPFLIGISSVLFAIVFVALRAPAAGFALAVALVMAGILLPLLSGRLARRPGERSTILAGDLRNSVTEGLLGVEELILLGAVDRQAAGVEELSARLVAEQEKLAGIAALSQAGNVVCAGLGVIAIFLTAGAAVTAGTISPPALVMLILFATASFEAVGPMAAALQLLPGTRAAVARLLVLADAPPPVLDPAFPAPLPHGSSISFSDVSFAYGEGKLVLDRFNLEIAQGERVALVGPSGSGKSTIVDLLLRFRDYRGSIKIGGMEIRDLAADDLRSIVTCLSQRPHLFNSSIRANILLGNPDAGEADLLRAVADAGLESWVSTLPNGLETAVGEGGKAVSGGEGRRIALARVLLKEAPIIILDEPTEGLDILTEEQVVARLVARTAGRTVLVITHRPACLKLADRDIRL